MAQPENKAEGRRGLTTAKAREPSRPATKEEKLKNELHKGSEKKEEVAPRKAKKIVPSTTASKRLSPMRKLKTGRTRQPQAKKKRKTLRTLQEQWGS